MASLGYPTSTKPVAIVGAGLGGLFLALALHAQSIPAAVYELRPIDSALGGAVMLSPNSLRLFDKLGVYSRIRPKGYDFEWLDMKTDENVLIGKYCFGSEDLFGYKALRIYRQVLIQELRAMCQEAGISIVYGKKFEKVLAETDDGATIEFADGTTVDAALVVGTDGLHSKVRQHIAPDLKPQFMGSMAVAGAVKTKDVRLPSSPAGPYHLPVSIFGAHGVFILAPQDIDGSELLMGTQIFRPEPDRATVQEIGSSPEKMLSLLKGKYNEWSDLVQSAMDNAIPETMYIWPFYHVPLLPSWASPSGKVIIIGDAAHALSPTLGQGANQAIEDALSLSLLLQRMPTWTGPEFHTRLGKWQKLRQDRINLLLEMTQKMNNNRLPLEERKKLSPDAFWKPNMEHPGEEMRWIYEDRLDEASVIDTQN